jgi:hypothetical protein
VTDGNGGANYAVTFAASSAGVITPRAITVAAQTDTKVYDGTTSSSGTPLVTSGTVVGGDTLGVSQAFATKDAGTGKVINAAGSVSDGNSGNNYAITFVADGTGVITPRAITVAANGIDKIYDASTVASVTYSDDRLAGDVLSASGSASFADKNVGAGKPVAVSAIALSGPDAPNYTVTSATAATFASITPAALAIRADDASRTESLPNPPFSASFAGLQGDDVPGSLAGSLRFSTPATQISPPGGYAIDASGLASANYTITYVPGVLTVNGVPPGAALGDPLATAYAPMNPGADPVFAFSSYAGVGDFMFAMTGSDGSVSGFLNMLPATAAGGGLPRRPGFPSPCSARTPFAVLRCAGPR